MRFLGVALPWTLFLGFVGCGPSSVWASCDINAMDAAKRNCLDQIVYSTAISAEQLKDWGWRIPFLLSGLLFALSLWIRLKLHESPVFAALRDRGDRSAAPIGESFGRWANLRVALVALFGIMIGQGAIWFTAFFYTQSFMERMLKVPPKEVDALLLTALLNAPASASGSVGGASSGSAAGTCGAGATPCRRSSSRIASSSASARLRWFFSTRRSVSSSASRCSTPARIAQVTYPRSRQQIATSPPASSRRYSARAALRSAESRLVLRIFCKWAG